MIKISKKDQITEIREKYREDAKTFNKTDWRLKPAPLKSTEIKCSDYLYLSVTFQITYPTFQCLLIEYIWND